MGLVDLKGEVVQRSRLRSHRPPRCLWNRYGAPLFEHPEDLRVAAEAIGDREEGDAVELLHEFQPYGSGIEVLHHGEVLHTKNDLA